MSATVERDERSAILARGIKPERIAIVGASERHGSFGWRYMRALLTHSFAGDVIPINPSRASVMGVTATSSLDELEVAPDLIVFAVDAATTIDAIGSGPAGGLGVVFASGFSETGPEGAERERSLAKAASGHRRILGPNSPGLIRLPGAVAIASGLGLRANMRSGGLSIVSQSGGVGALLAEMAMDAGIGVACCVCTGNELDVGIGDVLLEFAADQETEAVIAFVEGVRDGRSLLTGLRAAAAANKPVVVIAGGRGASSRAAAASHTGALASPFKLFAAAVRDCGAFVVEDVQQALQLAEMATRISASWDGTAQVVTTSGGAGVLLADQLEEVGVELPEPSKATVTAVKAVVPAFAALSNPLDVSGMVVQDGGSGLDIAVRASLGAEPHRLVVVGMTVQPPDLATAFAESMITTAIDWPGQITVAWPAGDMSTAAVVALREAGVPVFREITLGAHSLGLLREMTTWRESERETRPAKRDADGEPLPSAQRALLAELARCGVALPTYWVVDDPNSAREAVAGRPGPFVAKVTGSAHKTEIGGVRLGLVGADEVADAVADLLRLSPTVLVQEQLAGVELLVGAITDPQLGAFIGIGAGGVLAEFVDRVEWLPLPVEERRIALALERLGVDALLAGWRGAAQVDRQALTLALTAFADIAWSQRAFLGELEANPVIAGATGTHFVDIRWVPAGASSKAADA